MSNQPFMRGQVAAIIFAAIFIAAIFTLTGCQSTLATNAPCPLSERHAQDKVVKDHPVEKTTLPKHIDQNITDRQALGDAVADYNDLRRYVAENCK